MRATGRIAISAVTFLLAGGGAAAPSNAAFYGGEPASYGGCCADVEKRVGELEAVTAQKDISKVSLTIWGEVNRSLLMWDNLEANATVLETASGAGSGIRLSGQEQIKSGWNAGFVVELGIADSPSLMLGGQYQGESQPDAALETRLANWFIESERLGRVTLGQARSATDGITMIDLSQAHTDAVPWHNSLLFVRHANTDHAPLEWNGRPYDQERVAPSVVRYDSPTIYGFILSAAWGEEGSFDAALRFKEEWHSLRFAAGAGYMSARGNNDLHGGPAKDTHFLSGSASVMHVPTGVFVNFAAGRVNPHDTAMFENEGSMYFVQLGLERRFLAYGATTIYGEYGRYGDYGSGLFTAMNGGREVNEGFSAAAADRWGVGVVQQFSSSAVEMFGQFQYFAADGAGADIVIPPDGGATRADTWYGVVVGSRLKF